MFEWIKENWVYLLLIAVVVLFFTGAGVSLFTVKKQLNQVVEYQRAVDRELQNIATGLRAIQDISVNLADGIGSLESSTGRIETAVDGLESANSNIEYTVDIGTGLVGESERIIRDSLAILDSLSAEIDTNSGNGRGD